MAGRPRRVVCPGSFDPITLAHLDVIERAADLFDEVLVAVGPNPAKRGLFNAAERVELVRAATAELTGVRVQAFSGLVVQLCRDEGAVAIVKGLRAAGDLDGELQMAQMNAALAPEVRTVFLPTAPEHGYLSSSLVKEVAGLGGDVSRYLPAAVHAQVLVRVREQGGEGEAER